MMHGQGVYEWADGRKYEGPYVEDKKSGFGIFKWPDGKRYEGPWANGFQHGQGTFYFPTGEVKVGEWENGKRVRWLDDENNDVKNDS